ncbi:MAG: 2-oxoglutarate dehydrogenase, E2 component, dihydrolipoamide succinyltransferase [Acidobacteriales bacterium]|nr:2-oxoglutarate dehydrogenase, E2 component, dihydrolipoamide succinyltransferase [Terriglobales bacterium]
MPTDVTMPQMGESIFEGTLTKWLKKPGDKVTRDEPLFEISTDKVDAEIPAPASGVLQDIKVQEGATVQVNTVVATISEGAAASAPAPSASATAPSPAPATNVGAPSSTQRGEGGTTTPPTTPAPAQSSGPATPVTMPQMGESIFEGTLTKWLKKVGDQVTRDEPLFEISTDKVDAEIPAPASGILTEIKVQEGTTVQVNSVVATIGGAAGASPVGASPQAGPTAAPAPATTLGAPSSTQRGEGGIATPPASSTPAAPSAQSTERVRSSPLVRKIAKDNNVDLTKLSGTGNAGRITKDDIQAFIAQHGAQRGTVGAPSSTQRGEGGTTSPTVPTVAPTYQPQSTQATAVPSPTVSPAAPGELVPMSKMRSIIARRMVESKQTSAHVHTVFKVDMTRIVRIREREKNKFEQRNGVKLTYMPFITRALIAGIKTMPIINTSVEGDSIRYHKQVNVGIAVALDWGLIVPVVKQAENLSFVGLQRAINDVAERARNKKLQPDEVAGGTVTITNPGIFGPQFGMPIINQPQVAILGMGGMFKEPVVITDKDGNDSIAIRQIIRLTLGYDHRIIDGADADRFMVAVRQYLENWSEDIG